MKILYTTDLHGDAEKYQRLEEVARKTTPAIVINGGDMLPKKVNLFQQDKFITGRLSAHFESEGAFNAVWQLKGKLACFQGLLQGSAAGGRDYWEKTLFGEFRLAWGGRSWGGERGYNG